MKIELYYNNSIYSTTVSIIEPLFNGQETDMFANAFSDDYDVPLDGWMD